MLKQESLGRLLAPGSGLGALMISALTVLVAGCNERERLTFPTPTEDVGPITTIDQPSVQDTTVDQGPDFVVSGRTIDPEGVDTVYFLVIGGNQPGPYRPSAVTDTVFWGVPISTSGRSGQTLTVEVYGVDREGNQGAHSTREIRVR
jgi:hypothetical protein